MFLKINLYGAPAWPKVVKELVIKMEQSTFRQTEDRHVSVEVTSMLWSPKMDLIALANLQGEVVLHRLSWQKVWTIPAPADNVTVGSMAWRPDGRILAVGYTHGKVCLCHIENADVLHEVNIHEEVTSMSWVSQVFPDGSSWSPRAYPEDTSDHYLPKLEPLNKREESVEDAKKVKNQKELNLLVVGSAVGNVYLFAYGIFPCGSIILMHPSIQDKRSRVNSAMISQDLYTLWLILEVTEDDSGDCGYYLASMDTTLLASRHQELRLLALKYAELSSLLEYLNSTIQQMTEAWEDILMEMDDKLLKFAEEKKQCGSSRPAVSVSTDLLEMLLMGRASTELRLFLLHELTEKGLKKLGLSIESSYLSIQKLVVRLQNVGVSIMNHLRDLYGMSMWYDRFGVVGLTSKSLHEAVMASCTFVMKASELHQVIDRSIKSLKAFFRWLYVVMLRLAGELPPTQELSKMTQHDFNFVAEFIRDNFDQLSLNKDDSKKPGFKLEKVGQYLRKEDLQFPPDNSKNPWVKFSQSHPVLANSTLLYSVKPNNSLVQVQQILEEKIELALTKPTNVIGRECHSSCLIKLFSMPKNNKKDDKEYVCRFSQFSMNNGTQMYTVFTAGPLPYETLYIIRTLDTNEQPKESFEIAAVCVGSIGTTEEQDEGDDGIIKDSSLNTQTSSPRYKMLDVSYYDEKTISLLLQDESKGNALLTQLPVARIVDSFFTKVPHNANKLSLSELTCYNVGDHIDPSTCRVLDNMKARNFAVSGSRRVAAVLFSSRRRCRVFLLDAEDDEDDDTMFDSSCNEASANECKTVDKSESEAWTSAAEAPEPSTAEGDSLAADDEDKENTSVMETE
ncbi:anaphase-promoting complex subunit 4 isoform X1 [Octopus bimaculoides]|uniref:anaphase-promoting complex subunit 4 isoform X1 n=2 Tax=Octopus bimaculoides TaxID=37653 RepID=UPI0022E69BF5|nr:anaphase-promoting complex subunit 4 isoform X1 [Octopus bimaculoides]